MATEVTMKPLLTLLLALAPLASLEAQTVNGCSLALAENRLTSSSVTVTFPNGNLSYDPDCFIVKPGVEITFSGSFMSHPLRGGTVAGGIPTPDPASPIPATSSGSTVTFNLNQPGTFGYYCDFHGGGFSMFGAVIVAVFADGFDGGGNYCEWSTVGGVPPCA
jgi:plastocyanin